jgi:hypothetical protein
MNLEERLSIPVAFSPLTGNERARFYIENRELIETWAALRLDAGEAIEERFPELADHLSADLQALGDADATVAIGTYNHCSTVEITRQHWNTTEEGSPLRVVLESGERNLLDRQGNLRLYTGVRAKQSHPLAATYADQANPLRDTLRAALGNRWKSSPPRWPYWRFLPLDQENWSVDSVLQCARADMLRVWAAAAPAIEDIFQRVPPRI